MSHLFPSPTTFPLPPLRSQHVRDATWPLLHDIVSRACTHQGASRVLVAQMLRVWTHVLEPFFGLLPREVPEPGTGPASSDDEDEPEAEVHVGMVRARGKGLGSSSVVWLYNRARGLEKTPTLSSDCTELS